MIEDAKELDAFSLVVNGRPIDAKTIQFLRSHFHTNRKGHLTLEGFLDFYLSQTAGIIYNTLYLTDFRKS